MRDLLKCAWPAVLDAARQRSPGSAGGASTQPLADWRGTQALALARRLPSLDHLGRYAGEMARW